MDEDEADVLAHMTFPTAHRLQIHSTNPLERLNAEIKRRTGVAGNFPGGDHPPGRSTAPGAKRRVVVAAPSHASRITQTRNFRVRAKI